MVNNKKGSQGIGTLIIFIAMILVAAVAAGVLIRTASSLQGKAENTGTEVQQRLGTGFSIVEVVANDTSDGIINGGTDQVSVTVQLAPGSDPIKLGDVTLSIVSDDGTQSYTNSSTIGTNTYVVSPVKGDISDGYFDREDVVTLSFLVPNGQDINENEEFTVRIYPGVGSPVPISIITPPSMTDPFTVLK